MSINLDEILLNSEDWSGSYNRGYTKANNHKEISYKRKQAGVYEQKRAQIMRVLTWGEKICREPMHSICKRANGIFDTKRIECEDCRSELAEALAIGRKEETDEICTSAPRA